MISAAITARPNGVKYRQRRVVIFAALDLLAAGASVAWPFDQIRRSLDFVGGTNRTQRALAECAAWSERGSDISGKAASGPPTQFFRDALARTVTAFIALPTDAWSVYACRATER